MVAKKFELFIGYLGNGATVCNKAVCENGDYKQIAHISEAGNIKYYVPVDYIPGDALLRIEHLADTHRENTKQRLDRELTATQKWQRNHSFSRILEEVLDCLPFSQTHDFITAVYATSGEKQNDMLIEKYLEMH